MSKEPPYGSKAYFEYLHQKIKDTPKEKITKLVKRQWAAKEAKLANISDSVSDDFLIAFRLVGLHEFGNFTESICDEIEDILYES